MINPYSFSPYSQRNSSYMGNSSMKPNKPTTFREKLRYYFQRLMSWIYTGYSVSKTILWCGSIACIFVVLPLVLADTIEHQQELDGMMKAYAA